MLKASWLPSRPLTADNRDEAADECLKRGHCITMRRNGWAAYTH